MEPIAQGDLKAIEKKCTNSLEKTSRWSGSNSTKPRFASTLNPTRTNLRSLTISSKPETNPSYKQGEGADLCLGHVPSTAKLMFVRLTSVSTAYWRGDQDREQLVRIYGMVEPTKEALKATLTRLEEAKKRDHRNQRPATFSHR